MSTKNITLFVISYTDIDNDDNLIDLIKNRLSQCNISTNDTLNMSHFYSNYSHCASRLSKVQEVAKSYGGECLSQFYINNDTKLEFKCKEKHIWMTTPHNIFDGCWCHQCGIKNAIKTRKLKYLSCNY